ncbi:RNA-binding cell elongation regulator Jag/EloR [Peribacillus deserti]|uniref:RNA-binding protein KhpB n=1 Tax=Peribacillus deserti TaxID=673318 RepID=A0A2N5M564_9BACI|nr:RNA-binding cell elongation regulator Jag/EloR [Peribacillus deserti]PLT29504.1 protein jag [Peribacillus deserti]
MKQVTATGHTVDAAVESALAQLSTTRDRVQIEVIEQGKKGFLGIFGNKEAQVIVTLPPDPVEETERYIRNVSREMGVEVTIDVKRSGKNVTYLLSGDKIALLIGKRGQTLNSLQYLAQLAANSCSRQYLTIILDAEDYRTRRNETLTALAKRMAEKAMRSGREVALEPMPSYERKVIHSALMEFKNIKTYSNGAEPYRHIVIAPSKLKK